MSNIWNPFLFLLYFKYILSSLYFIQPSNHLHLFLHLFFPCFSFHFSTRVEDVMHRNGCILDVNQVKSLQLFVNQKPLYILSQISFFGLEMLMPYFSCIVPLITHWKQAYEYNFMFTFLDSHESLTSHHCFFFFDMRIGFDFESS